jgi:hypothetical protein
MADEVKSTANPQPEPEDAAFGDEKLMLPTALETQVGHDLGEDEQAFIEGVCTVCNVDPKLASRAYAYYRRMLDAGDPDE